MQPYAIHRDPEYFPDPLRFNPERFVDKSAESNPAFMPFGLGPRMCVGMRFAQNELRIALANFVLNYRLLPNPNLEVSKAYISKSKIKTKISTYLAGILQRQHSSYTKIGDGQD